MTSTDLEKNNSAGGTPMQRQFDAIKQSHQDCIIFFRAGDFYEMFGQDAQTASKALNIVLTTRNKNTANAVPMCGVPYHARDNYIKRLVDGGHKVALCEQVEPASGKGLVRREVVRIFTPGTYVGTDDDASSSSPKYVLALDHRQKKPPGALLDMSTGEFLVLELEDLDSLYAENNLVYELVIPFSSNLYHEQRLNKLKGNYARAFRENLCLERLPEKDFEHEQGLALIKKHFGVADLSTHNLSEQSPALGVAGALLSYALRTQKDSLLHISQIRTLNNIKFLQIDGSTVRNLEVFKSLSGQSQQHTLFGVLNKTQTPMGARLLRKYINYPLNEVERINNRLDSVSELQSDLIKNEAVRAILGKLGDLERFVARLSLPDKNLTNMQKLRNSLTHLQELDTVADGWQSPLINRIFERIDPLPELLQSINKRLKTELPTKTSSGGYIAEGFNIELDQLRDIANNVKQVILNFEETERRQTGISALKVRYNRVFGYYIEVPHAHKDKIPQHYHRRQTLVNSERYSTNELKDMEDKILGAEERIITLESEIFEELCTIVRGFFRRLKTTIEAVANLDVFSTLAKIARDYNYCRPTLLDKTESRRISISDGRHPMMERMEDMVFVPNSVDFVEDECHVMLITGPNMAGKSTVMRQTALLQLMAQMGSFVPATAMRSSIVDRIFTRIGASDDIVHGQSTFMAEMVEAASIVQNMTENSLIILDEVGRGTSTYDGISIAWALVEYINRVKPFTMFATHYHELTKLDEALPYMQNFHIPIERQHNELVFMRLLKKGQSNQSYGIDVARIAGIPEAIISRARQVMQQFSNGELQLEATLPDIATESVMDERQVSVLDELSAIKPDNLSPREALDFIYELKKIIS